MLSFLFFPRLFEFLLVRKLGARANGGKIQAATPMGCILTLPATGSETNTAAVVNRSEHKLKKAFANPKVQPKFAILDPEVTYSLPTRQLINGVIDPFVHVIEQYLTYPIGASVQDRFAESILINLIDIGQEAIAAGLESALIEGDSIVTAYRQHGIALGRGVSMNAAMAELYGKENDS